MIRVGFILANSASWTGGLVYLRNLISAVMSLPDRGVEPVLIVLPETSPAELEGFEGIEVVRTPLIGPSLPAKLLRKGTELLLGGNILLERFLRGHDISVLSHSGVLGRRAGIPALAWIPDFQHVRRPDFFQPEEIAARDRGYRRIASWAHTILLSSADSQRDLAKFAPDAIAKSRILHFMAGIVDADDVRGPDYLAAAYGIDRPYFYLPNQFWKHKNHRLVIDALSLLVRLGRAPLVVCTGKTEDRRDPGHYPALMRHAEAVGAAPCFKVLGLIPYADLSVLFRHAVALINPSHFEGWSTTVEEAKSFGKAIILSDIPVHREQAPQRGVYVPADDPAAMAAAMAKMLADLPDAQEAAALVAAATALPSRKQAFGETYQDIIMEAVRLG